jgi:hypothetical protein
LAEDLRSRGFDALSTQEARMDRASDREQIEFAFGEQRAIFTYNISDFAALHREWHEGAKEHWGIIISEQFPDKRYGELLRRILNLLDALAADEIRGTLRNLAEFKE